MKCIVQTIGMLMIISSVWLRAIRRITINLTAFWGIAGMLLITAGTASPLPGWIEKLDAGRKRILYLFGGIILAGGYIASLRLSWLTMKNQEQAIRLSLLAQENEQILAKLEKMNEENSLCNQYNGSGGCRNSLSGIVEENR